MSKVERKILSKYKVWQIQMKQKLQFKKKREKIGCFITCENYRGISGCSSCNSCNSCKSCAPGS